MTRTIKQVSHDLKPIIVAIQDLSRNLNTMLSKLQQDLALADAKVKEHFEICLAATITLDQCSKLAFKYISEVDEEADQARIKKHY